MNKYWIEYGNRSLDDDYIEPIATQAINAYDIEHAIDKFLDQNDDFGFVMIRIARAPKEGKRPRWTQIA